MKTKKSGLRFLAIFLIIIVLLSTIWFFTGQQITGFTTISLSEAELSSQSDFFTGKTWILTTVQGGLGQKATGTITQESIFSKTKSDKPTKDFGLSIVYDKQNCNYPISRDYDATPVIYIDKKEWSDFSCLAGKWQPESYYLEKLESFGISSSQAFGIYGKYSPSLTCYATYITVSAKPGYFGETNYVASGKITTEIDGKQEGEFEFDTFKESAGYVGDNVYVQWVGNYETGKSCPYTTQNPFMPIYKDGQWRTISYSNYLTYITQYDDIIDDTKSEGDRYLYGVKYSTSNKGDVNTLISEFNKLSDNTLQVRTMGTIDSKTEEHSGSVNLEMESPLQYPVLTFYIKALSLGIYTPVSIPRIISATSQQFKTGDKGGSIQVTVQNAGDESGVFKVSATCDAPFLCSDFKDVGVNPNELENVNLKITATTDEATCKYCTVKASSAHGEDTKRVKVCVDPIQTCTPNQLSCSIEAGKEVIIKCDSEGIKTTIIDTCEDNEICSNAKCVLKETPPTPPPPTVCKWYDLPCKIKVTSQVQILASILAFLIIIAFGVLTIPEAFRKKDKWIGYTLAIAISVVAGLLIYTIFWAGVIIALIALFIFIIVKARGR